MKVYIMRGLPGSGKSSWVKNFCPTDTVCSADHFHTVNGEYRYDPKNAGAAHGACLRQFVRALDVGTDVLVVDNTNTTAVELAPYVRLCEAFGIEYEIVNIACDFATACERNIHAVPPATIWNMHQNLMTERIPPYWKQTFVEANN